MFIKKKIAVDLDGVVFDLETLYRVYTEMFDDDSIGYFDVSFSNNYDEYIKEFQNVQKKFKEDKTYSTENALNEIWLSCALWFSFMGILPPLNKNITIPQFIWDKYELVNDKYYVNLTIMVHHGFADGFHIAKFISLLNENISSFN